MAGQKKGMYKVTILTYRKKGMSEQDFHEHWTEKHPKVVGDLLKKYGIVRYTQYHTPSWMRREASEKLKTLGNFATDNLADYDGYVELWMPDLSCYENARKDPYYDEVVKPDEESFFDMGRSSLTIGWEETYIESGDIVNIS